MTAVRFENVTKLYHKKDSTFSRRDLFTALSDVSFAVEEGEAVGLAGPNGAGKTTLMRLAAGITAPTAGRVSTRGRVMPVLGLEGCLNHELTGIENAELLLSVHLVGAREKKTLLPRMLDFAGIGDFADMQVKKYSNGMRSRLSFAIAAHLEFNILLLDEVFAVGDKEFQEKSRAKIGELIRAGRTIFLASHSAQELKRFASRVLWIEKDALVDDGPADRVLAERGGARA